MKKPFFLSRNFLPWLIVHLGIPALLGISLFFAPPLKISTQLFDLFPKTDMSEVAEADNILTEKNGRETVILFASSDFEKAKNAGIEFYNEFKNSGEIESCTFLFDSDAIAGIAEYFFKHRFVFADHSTIELLETEKSEEIAQDGLVMAFGAFNYIPLTHIDKDPFLLTERGIREFLSSSMMSTSENMSIKDDVLAVQKDGVWYVILRMTLTPEAISVINIEKNIIGSFYKTADLIKEKDSDIEFYFSGAPFHSYESASNAQKEVTLLGSVSIIFILLLFLSVFRSPIPIIFSIMDILISLFLGATVTFLIFREIHAFTFIFGTVLIGICIDYSIHFFIQWRGNRELKSGQEIRSNISKSMIMCFVSTVICCSAVLFAPMSIFKQFSVFALAGLLSSFLTAYCIYPLVKLQDEQKRQLILPNFEFIKKIETFLSPVIRVILVSFISVIFIIILFFNPHGIKLNNDFSSLYSMPPHLLESEIRTAMVLDQRDIPLYFIITGSSTEETLINEEKFALRLKEEIKKGNFRSYLGTSMSTPSLEKQRKTYSSMSNLLPLAESQYEKLGFPPDYKEIFFNEYAAGDIYLLPENAPSWTGTSNLWIGEVNGTYYSCLFIFHAKDKQIFSGIADEFDFVYLVNMEEIINREFNNLTKNIVLFFFAAYIIVIAIIFSVYPFKDSIKICIVPVLVVLAVLAVLAAMKIPLGFLPIVALILVFGLGMDFMLYMSGSKKGKDKKLTRIAVFLSFLTTTLSFGLLSLSSFTPLYILGLTVAVGLTAALIFTMLLQGKAE